MKIGLGLYRGMLKRPRPLRLWPAKLGVTPCGGAYSEITFSANPQSSPAEREDMKLGHGTPQDMERRQPSVA